MGSVIDEKWCPVCGEKITEDNQLTDRECPECGRRMCDACDFGVGCTCAACEEGWHKPESEG
jgi:hypothetical protein